MALHLCGLGGGASLSWATAQPHHFASPASERRPNPWCKQSARADGSCNVAARFRLRCGLGCFDRNGGASATCTRSGWRKHQGSYCGRGPGRSGASGCPALGGTLHEPLSSTRVGPSLYPGPSCGCGIASGSRWLACNALDRKSTRLNSSHVKNSYAVFCLIKKNYSSDQKDT